MKLNKDGEPYSFAFYGSLYFIEIDSLRLYYFLNQIKQIHVGFQKISYTTWYIFFYVNICSV